MQFFLRSFCIIFVLGAVFSLSACGVGIWFIGYDGGDNNTEFSYHGEPAIASNSTEMRKLCAEFNDPWFDFELKSLIVFHLETRPSDLFILKSVKKDKNFIEVYYHLIHGGGGDIAFNRTVILEIKKADIKKITEIRVRGTIK